MTKTSLLDSAATTHRGRIGQASMDNRGDEREHNLQFEMDLNSGPPHEDQMDQMDRTVREALRMAGNAAPTQEQISELRTKAEALLSTSDLKNEAEGIKDYENYVMSMGLPATRAMFRHMLSLSGLRGADKQAVVKEITEFSPVTEEGCFEVTFYDTIAKTGSTAYLRLAVCKSNHDLGAQLKKLETRCDPSKWKEVLAHLSTLVALGRQVYATIAKDHEKLLEKLVGSARKKSCMFLSVDRTNTTLYVDPTWSKRIGIYVTMKDEIAAKIPSAMPKPATGGSDQARV